MQVEWQSVHEEQEGEYNLTWQFGPHVVNAVLYDTGEWVIRSGANGDPPVDLYSRGVFTRDKAIIEAQACMRDLTFEHVTPESERQDALIDTQDSPDAEDSDESDESASADTGGQTSAEEE